MARQGWRYFECGECGVKFRETCRDHSTPSSSLCITNQCRSNYYGGLHPVGSMPDLSLPVDRWGNLIDGSRFEKLDG